MYNSKNYNDQKGIENTVNKIMSSGGRNEDASEVKPLDEAAGKTLDDFDRKKIAEAGKVITSTLNTGILVTIQVDNASDAIAYKYKRKAFSKLLGTDIATIAKKYGRCDLIHDTSHLWVLVSTKKFGGGKTRKNEEVDTPTDTLITESSYVDGELKNIDPNLEYKAAAKFRSDGKETKWFNIDKSSAASITKWLKTVKQ